MKRVIIPLAAAVVLLISCSREYDGGNRIAFVKYSSPTTYDLYVMNNECSGEVRLC